MSSIITASMLFNTWNQNKVIYCHWKSNEHLRPGLEGTTDLDVLIDKKSKDVAEGCLKETGFIKLTSQFGAVYSEVEDWINIDEESANLIHIHLHYRMATGHKGLKEYSLPWVDLALKTRVLEDNVYICEPNLELVILYTRIALKATKEILSKAQKGKYITDEPTLKEINYLKARIDKEVVKQIVRDTFGEECESICHIIMKESISSNEFLQMVSICKKWMNKYQIYSDYYLFFSIPFYKRALQVRHMIKKKFSINIITKKTAGNHGLRVAFIGQDGAGKSTVNNDIEKWLTYKLEAKKFYLGSGDLHNSFQKRLLAVLKKKKGKLVNIIKGFLTISDLKHIARRNYKILKSADKYSKKGGIALFDRYPQTQYTGINDGPKIRERFEEKNNNKYIRSIVLAQAKQEKYINKAVAIAPNLVFKLTLPPEESIRRKPEENYEMVCRKHEIIKALNFTGSYVVNVDATMDYSEELVLIKKEIWNQLYSHYS